MPRRLGTRSGETCLRARGASHPRQNLCAPRRRAASQASLSQARPGVGEEGARNALWRPVSGAGGSGTCFFPNPGPHVSALGSQIQDPGSGSRIGTRPALGASQKARGLHRRPLSFGASGQAGSGGFSSRWGGLQWQPLMLGTFQRKVLFDEYATRIAGTRVMVGVHTSLMAAPNGGPGFLAAGTSHVHGHLHGLL